MSNNKQFIEGFNGSIEVLYNSYDDGRIKTLKMKREKLSQALIRIHDKLLYGIDEDTNLDQDENALCENLIKQIDEVNGDGCCYILTISSNDNKIQIGHMDEDYDE